MIHLFECQTCGLVLERDVPFGETPESIECDCHGEMMKMYLPVGVVFKGRGWSSTDQRRKRDDEIVDDGKEKIKI